MRSGPHARTDAEPFARTRLDRRAWRLRGIGIVFRTAVRGVQDDADDHADQRQERREELEEEHDIIVRPFVDVFFCATVRVAATGLSHLRGNGICEDS